MRARLFRAIIGWFDMHPSRLVNRLMLQVLLLETGKAFGRKGRLILLVHAPLEAYGAYSKACLRTGNNRYAYECFYKLGSRIRLVTGLTKPDDLEKLVFFLYKNIGITMSGSLPGMVIVSRCFFSGIYSPKDCKCMSAADAGLITGIFGGGSFAFLKRLTEGCEACVARFSMESESDTSIYDIDHSYEETDSIETLAKTGVGGVIMDKKKTAIVIGSGAGGAMMAKELQGEYQVTVLEAGKRFQPFSWPVNLLAKLRGSGLFFDERLIRFLLPNMIIQKTKDMVLVRGLGKGGTTTLATGNAVRYDKALQEIGIDLSREYEALYKELPITTEHEADWTQTTRKMFELFKEMGLDPVVTPKLLNPDRCSGCGHCAIGCPNGAKWDSRVTLGQAVRKGARVISGCKVTKLDIKEGKVKAVYGRKGLKKLRFQADLVVLAAGGLGSPVILEKSGISCEKRLFVDPVLCVAGPLPGIHQERQILMPFISQQEGYILSPYMDYLSFFFDKRWRYPMTDVASIMIKLADEEEGYVVGNKVRKQMSPKDKEVMDQAVNQCREILKRLGVPEEKQFLGTLNAGHPGGMLPLTKDACQSLHHSALPENLYVADATILPRSMGNPPMLTIMALAKRIAAVIKDKDAK